MIITPDFYIDILQVKEYNSKQSVWHMKFLRDYQERKRGWVVDVQAKNGVSTRQRFCTNKAEAKAFVQIEYGAVV